MGRSPPHPEDAAMSDAGPTPRSLARRATLALLAATPFAAPFAGVALAESALAEAPSLLVAGPPGGRMDRWARALTAAFSPVLPAGTRLQPSTVGGEDGVTGANQFATRVTPDGNTLLLAPGDAALAWLVGDPRARFDVAKWLGVVAGIAPAVVCGRIAASRPGEKIRVGLSGPVGPDLASLLGLELAGLAATPVFGVLDQIAAIQALASRAVDAVLLRGGAVTANLGPLAQVGVAPLFTLGATGGDGRDALLPEVPNLVEFAQARGATPAAALLGGWRGVAAAAQVEYALVLPQLTPAALVALWRQAGSLAAASPLLHDATDRTSSVGGPAAHPLTQALAPDVPAITELRAWLATRLGWRPPG